MAGAAKEERGKGGRAGRPSAPAVATFEPYFWEAYNEIVEPRRWDHYLLRRWLPTLGPLGLTLVKVLRDHCYFNRGTGVLRDTCEVDMDELAGLVGVSRATLFRELGRNVALGLFVRRVEQYQMVNGRPQQTKNLYQVCMDDPIHPDDRERYERLREQKELQREQPLPKKIVKHGPAPTYGSQNETHRDKRASHESQIETYESQNETPKMPSQIATASILPYPPGDLFTKESCTPPAGSPSHTCVPPEGEGEADCPLAALWLKVLGRLAEKVNKPTLEAHLRPLRLESLGADGTVLLLAPHAATREWIEKRHLGHVEEALGEALGRPVTVRLRLAKEFQAQVAASLGLSLDEKDGSDHHEDT